MTINVVCPKCQHKLRAPESAAGRKAKCPKCGTAIEITVPTTKPATVHAPDNNAKTVKTDRRTEAPPVTKNEFLVSALDELAEDAANAVVEEPLKSCPYCSEEIKRSAVKCKHCGEFLDDLPNRTSTGRDQSKRAGLKRVGDGQFSYGGSYSVAFAAVQQAMKDCNVSIKEKSADRGLIRGKCRYGVNLFGITVTATFYVSGNTTRIELAAGLSDAMDTFGVCKKKVDEVSQRLVEVMESADATDFVGGQHRSSKDDAIETRPPSYAERSGPSFKGKAITGFWFAVASLFFGPASIVAMIFCGNALTGMSTSNNRSGKGWAIAGSVIACFSLVSWILFLINRLS